MTEIHKTKIRNFRPQFFWKNKKLFVSILKQKLLINSGYLEKLLKNRKLAGLCHYENGGIKITKQIYQQ